MDLYNKNNKRWISRGLVSIFVIGFVSVGLTLTFHQAQAFSFESEALTLSRAALETASGACPGMSACPPEGSAKAMETIQKDVISPKFRVALLSTLLNLFTFVLDRLAYEAAVAIATAGEGQTTLFYGKEATAAWEDFGMDIAGEAIGSISDLVMEELDFEFDVCSPGGVGFGSSDGDIVKLGIAVGIKQAYKPKEPRCDFREIMSNWEGFIGDAVSNIENIEQRNGEILQGFAKGLRPGNNELSASININVKVQGEVLKKKTQEFTKQTSSSGFKDLTDVITGQVKTPASILQKNFESELIDAKKGSREVNMDAVVNAGELIGGMALHSAGVFANTLLSSLFSRIYSGLFDVELQDVDLGDIEGLASSGVVDAKERFSSIISTTPIKITEYSALTEFLSCSAGGIVSRGINNCVLDTNFASAIARGQGVGSAMTVQEAIDEGLLNGNWPLISPNDLSKNQDPFCYTFGYCYGNLVKLRKARIIPIGWELAAEQNDLSNPATLQEIINGYDTCTNQGTLDDGSNKWCHLIDPNWVLKYPT